MPALVLEYIPKVRKGYPAAANLLAVDSLTLDADNVPRCQVKEGAAEARFSRAAWMQLAEAVREDGEGGYVLTAAGKEHPLAVKK